jgi:aspartate aminotransferase
MAITAKASELKAAGKNVIGLGAGEPDFDTPDHIKQAGINAIEQGKTKYTPVSGTPELKDAIIAKFKRDSNLEFSRKEIVVGSGAKQVLFNALLATLNPHDEVIIPAPYWVSYPDMVVVAEGKPAIVPCHVEDQFKLTPQHLKKALSDKTRWLILNSPSNPTGMAYTRQELRALADVLKDFPNVMIMADDIYEYLVYDGFEFTTLAEVAPELKDRILTVNGVSKAYSMTGWRIGYGAGPQWLIKAISDLQSHSTSNPCSISQIAATEALNGSHDFLADWLISFKRRRDLVVSKLNAIDGLECKTPQGAFYVFPSCKGLYQREVPSEYHNLCGRIIESSDDFCTYLLEEALVAAVPGSAFGLDGFFRISYATSDAVLEDACERIAKALAKLR